MSSFNGLLALARILLDGGMLDGQDVETWLRAVQEGNVAYSDPSCLTFVPGAKRALSWAWHIHEWPRFVDWLRQASKAYGLGEVMAFADAHCLHLELCGEKLVIDWLYVNRERWFGGVAILFNRVLSKHDLSMEALDTSWVNVVVAMGPSRTMRELCAWFGECQ